jgi:hypothetical protein
MKRVQAHICDTSLVATIYFRIIYAAENMNILQNVPDLKLPNFYILEIPIIKVYWRILCYVCNKVESAIWNTHYIVELPVKYAQRYNILYKALTQDTCQ